MKFFNQSLCGLLSDFLGQMSNVFTDVDVEVITKPIPRMSETVITFHFSIT